MGYCEIISFFRTNFRRLSKARLILGWNTVEWSIYCPKIYIQLYVINKEKTVLFDKDVNKWAMGSHEIRENCSTMNSNDTTLFSSCLLHYMSLNTRETFFSPEYGSKCKWEYLRLLILVFEPLVIKHVEIKHRGFTLVVILTSRWSDCNSIKSNGQSWL